MKPSNLRRKNLKSNKLLIDTKFKFLPFNLSHAVYTIKEKKKYLKNRKKQ